MNWKMLPLPLLIATTLTAAAQSARAGDSANAASSAQGRTEENRRIVIDAFDRWAAGGTSFFDCSRRMWSGASKAPAAARVSSIVAPSLSKKRSTSRLSTPVRPSDVRVFADGDHVITHWEGRATARDGSEYRNRYAWIFRMREGKVVEAWAFLDLTAYDDVLRRVPAQ